MTKLIGIGVIIGWLGIVCSSGAIIILGLACVTAGALTK